MASALFIILPAVMKSREALQNQTWDFAVIGAGPAGALAAYLLAAKNRVLLVDQAAFPREKVCGGCLGRGALRELERAGLGDLAARLNARPFDTLRMAYGGASAKFKIPQGLSVSRKALDFALIEAAQKKGVVFLPETKGILNSTGPSAAQLSLVQGEDKFEVRAGMVLICDGLSGTALQHFPELNAHIASDSLIGISASCEENPAGEGKSGTLQMACSSAGYVGLVLREDRRLEAAAAVRSEALKAAGSPARLVESILRGAGFAVPAGLAQAKWLGAPFLLRRRSVPGGERFLILGDAVGFVEPFTGEGMYWAFLQARAAAELLASGQFQWSPGLLKRWQKRCCKILKPRQSICRLVTLTLRSPFLCRLLLRLLARFPKMGFRLAQTIHGRD